MQVYLIYSDLTLESLLQGRMLTNVKLPVSLPFVGWGEMKFKGLDKILNFHPCQYRYKAHILENAVYKPQNLLLITVHLCSFGSHLGSLRFHSLLQNKNIPETLTQGF